MSVLGHRYARRQERTTFQGPMPPSMCAIAYARSPPHMTPQDVPTNQAPWRRGCSSLLYHIPVMRLEPGIIADSAAPRRKRTAIKPPKFLHAAVKPMSNAQAYLSYVNTVFCWSLLVGRLWNLQSTDDELSNRQSDHEVWCCPSEREGPKIKNTVCPGVFWASEFLKSRQLNVNFCAACWSGAYKITDQAHDRCRTQCGSVEIVEERQTGQHREHAWWTQRPKLDLTIEDWLTTNQYDAAIASPQRQS